MFTYAAYGLAIRSTLRLPELVPSTAAPEISFQLGRVHLASDAEAQTHYSNVTKKEAILFWNGVGTFQIRGGREITIDPNPTVDEERLRLFLLGPVLALLLWQRGYLVLHASAVEIGEEAVAFVGGCGWGKSTLAAGLHSRGYNLLADDVVAVHMDGQRNRVFPGFPRMKLWPDVAAGLGYSLEALPRIYPDIEKRSCMASAGPSQKALPLGLIYVIEEGLFHNVETLTPQEACIELVRHSYGIQRFQGVGADEHFLQCAKLANSVSCRRLRRRRSIEDLGHLLRLVEEDVATHASTPEVESTV